ncbi:hypothetical protein LGQ02_17970 [Bacillus shivajii]|uniref:hypothetical protein n=1 Tax=Bacillus shivajii TaxID=1983719 RepID=UPI001CFA81A2|nr:hypothetical protein [Bacillus shivajii]UCZ52673.1 hypothetical protein LGQ02_17970 [Bacillus shivajii]
MSKRLTEAQLQFLTNYKDLLQEVESAIQYVSDCYIQEDLDIGDRLMKSVMAGLISYNEENMTMYSVFGDDETAIEHLRSFQEAVTGSMKIEETCADTEERMRFVHETVMPRLQKWKQLVELKLVERNELD